MVFKSSIKLKILVLILFISPTNEFSNILDDYYEFDKFLDRLYSDISVHDLKVVEDFSDLSVDFVSDDIVTEAQDTISLLDKYVEDIDTNLDKERIKSKLKSLYIEAGDIDI